MSDSCTWLVIDLQELTIVKDAGEKLGLSIKGGAKNLATPDKSDEGIFISRVSQE